MKLKVTLSNKKTAIVKYAQLCLFSVFVGQEESNGKLSSKSILKLQNYIFYRRSLPYCLMIVIDKLRVNEDENKKKNM